MELIARGLDLEFGEITATRTLEASQWLAAEREAWMAALTLDPLLPEILLPSNYLGRKAWQQRQAVLREWPKKGLKTKAG